MTMHLEGPWLSTTGKRKGKVKFRNSAEARKARELDESWNTLQKKWGVEQETKKKQRAMTAPIWTQPAPTYRGANDPKPKSLNTWTTGAVSSKPSPQYTGDQVIGVTVLHKSCLQPVFSKQDAVDAAKMRR